MTRQPRWHVSPQFGVHVAKTFDSLAEAKTYGAEIAKKRAFRERLTTQWSFVAIYNNTFRGYHIPYMHIYYPVRGSGTTEKKILENMAKHGQPAFKWIKYPGYKRALARHKGTPGWENL